MCRIYPMEISPFITLKPSEKDCPPESWSDQAKDLLIASDGSVSAELSALIEASRSADCCDALQKVSICELLGFNVTAWKGNGYALYLPERRQLSEAIERSAATQLQQLI